MSKINIIYETKRLLPLTNHDKCTSEISHSEHGDFEVDWFEMKNNYAIFSFVKLKTAAGHHRRAATPIYTV